MFDPNESKNAQDALKRLNDAREYLNMVATNLMLSITKATRNSDTSGLRPEMNRADTISKAIEDTKTEVF